MNIEYFISLRTLRPGKYILHKEDCPFLPEKENRFSVGAHDSSAHALTEATGYFPITSGCPFCTRMKSDSNINEGIHNDFITSRQVAGSPETVLFAALN